MMQPFIYALIALFILVGIPILLALFSVGGKARPPEEELADLPVPPQDRLLYFEDEIMDDFWGDPS